MEKAVLRVPIQALTTARLARAHRFISATLQRRHNVSRRHKSTATPADNQAVPHTGYWADILNSAVNKEKEKDLQDEPLKTIQEASRIAPSPQTAESREPDPPPDQRDTAAKAKDVFGSRWARPAERRIEIKAASRNIAGIMVPPKPEEPDNCCMSGCVNCVWDMYGEELEEWAKKSAEVRERLQAQRASGEATGTMTQEPGMPSHVAVSMDDDGGGSETNWSSGLADTSDEGNLLAKIPVGIREFMRVERSLKQRHAGDKDAEV